MTDQLTPSPLMGKIPQEVFDLIKKLTGAQSIVIIACKDELPCNEEEDCKGHSIVVSSEGVPKFFVDTMLKMGRGRMPSVGGITLQDEEDE